MQENNNVLSKDKALEKLDKALDESEEIEERIEEEITTRRINFELSITTDELADIIRDNSEDIPITDDSIEILNNEVQEYLNEKFEEIDYEDLLDKVRKEIDRDNKRKELAKKETEFINRLLDRIKVKGFERSDKNYLVLRGILAVKYPYATSLEDISETNLDYYIELYGDKFDKIPEPEVK